MPRLAPIATLTLLLSSAPAHAAPWRFSGGAGVIVLGPASAPTGGLMPELRLERVLVSRDAVRASLAASAGGFVSGGVLGVIAGVAPTVEASPARSIRLSVSAGVDFGSVPVCNPWALCLSYLGIFPQAALGASYALDDRWSVQALVRARYVTTFGWEGASWQPALLLSSDL